MTPEPGRFLSTKASNARIRDVTLIRDIARSNDEIFALEIAAEIVTERKNAADLRILLAEVGHLLDNREEKRFREPISGETKPASLPEYAASWCGVQGWFARQVGGCAQPISEPVTPATVHDDYYHRPDEHQDGGAGLQAP